MFQNLKSTFTTLVIFNFIADIVLVLLSNTGWLPLKIGDFIFVSALIFLFSLYRLGWIFFWLVGTITLETIDLAPSALGVTLRPYQLLAMVTALAVFIKFVANQLTFSPAKPHRIDFALLAMAVGGFLSVVNASQKGTSLKLAAILVSFLVLYWLSRNFVEKEDDLKKIAPFFLAGSTAAAIYGIWQAVSFSHGLNSFEVMPGRPNATFPEADWLGIYLVFLLGIAYAIIYYFNNANNKAQDLISNQIPNFKIKTLQIASCWLLITLAFIALILTVSRSAWLGAALVTLVYLKIILTDLRISLHFWHWKKFFKETLFIASAGIAGLAMVYIFSLTDFQLFNRAQSAGTGLQKITVACPGNEGVMLPPQIISGVEQLDQYRCRHINIEDIETEKAAGNIVTEIYRSDPNVGIRARIYKTSWNEIKKHPILGIGWGSIGEVLGKDERGAALNSSNIFLEVWLGSGIVGLLAFSTVWIWIIARSIVMLRSMLRSKVGTQVPTQVPTSVPTLRSDAAVYLAIFLGAIAIIIPNLFNAGIFLGYVWVYLGAATGLLINRMTKKLNA